MTKLIKCSLQITQNIIISTLFELIIVIMEKNSYASLALILLILFCGIPTHAQLVINNLHTLILEASHKYLEQAPLSTSQKLQLIQSELPTDILYLDKKNPISSRSSQQQNLLPEAHLQQRLLQQKSRDDRSPPSSSQDNSIDTYMIFLIGALGGLLLITFFFCAFFCCKQMLRRTVTGHSNTKISNISLNYNFIFPPLNYEIFLKEVGQPNCDECVICLMQFQKSQIRIDLKLQQQNKQEEETEERVKQKKPSQINFFSEDLFMEQEQCESVRKKTPEMNLQVPSKSYKRKRKQFQENVSGSQNNRQIGSQIGSIINNSIIPEHASIKQSKEQLEIKYTVCGHFLHSKCLSDWLTRELNCPLCRQSFDDMSIAEWEQNLKIDFEKTYTEFQKRQLKSEREKKNKNQRKTIFEQTVEELQKSNTKNQQYIDNEINRESQNLQHDHQDNRALNSERQYTATEKYGIFLYRAIMKYHQGRKRAILEPNLQSQQSITNNKDKIQNEEQQLVSKSSNNYKDLIFEDKQRSNPKCEGETQSRNNSLILNGEYSIRISKKRGKLQKLDRTSNKKMVKMQNKKQGE